MKGSAPLQIDLREVSPSLLELADDLVDQARGTATTIDGQEGQ